MQSVEQGLVVGKIAMSCAAVVIRAVHQVIASVGGRFKTELVFFMCRVVQFIVFFMRRGVDRHGGQFK